MEQREIKVINALGIHARPAAKIIQTASKFSSKITFIKDNQTADAKSILHVMMMGVEFGSTVTVRAAGPDEKDAVAAIASLFERKFDED